MESNVRTALVTGAGGGIGRELCRLLHAAGYRVVAVSLVKDELASLKRELAHGPEIIPLRKDLAQPGAAEDVFAFCEKKKIRVDVLVNNVGFGLVGLHLDLPPERVRRMLCLNMVTMTSLCGLFGGRMRERGEGRVLNVASTISFQPLPFWAAYAATKAYVSSFSQAFAREMRCHGVTVTCLYPGITRTGFLEEAGLAPSRSRWSVGSLVHGAAMDPVPVVRAGFHGLMAGRRRVVPGFINRLHFLLIHVLPNALVTEVVYRFMRRYRAP